MLSRKRDWLTQYRPVTFSNSPGPVASVDRKPRFGEEGKFDCKKKKSMKRIMQPQSILSVDPIKFGKPFTVPPNLYKDICHKIYAAVYGWSDFLLQIVAKTVFLSVHPELNVCILLSIFQKYLQGGMFCIAFPEWQMSDNWKGHFRFMIPSEL